MSIPEIRLQVKIEFTQFLNIPYLVFYNLKIREFDLIDFLHSQIGRSVL